MEINIQQANVNDHKIIAAIGKIAVEETHRNSCSREDMNEYLQKNYTEDAIKAELADTQNIYHIIYYREVPADFLKLY